MQYIIDTDVVVACITESWLTDANNHVTYRIKNYGYCISHKYRECGKGGGVCFIYKPFLNVNNVLNCKLMYESFEYHCITICEPNNIVNLSIACIYRKQEVPFTQFCSDFLCFCGKVIEQSVNYFLLLGDFNVHYEYSNSMSNQLTNLITSYGFTQYVHMATCKSGHMLDLIFSNIYETPIHSVEIDKCVTESNYVKFDHYPISCFVSYDTSPKKDEYTVKTIRNINSIDIDLFIESCENSLRNNAMDMQNHDFKTAISNFNLCLQNNLDYFAPPSEKRYLKNTKHLPIRWIDDEYRQARNKRRSYERAYKDHHDTSKKALYLSQKNICARMAKRKMSKSLSGLINNRDKGGDLFKLLNSVLDNECTSVLPKCHNAVDLANDFNLFYLSKIDKIRDTIPYCTEPYLFNDSGIALLNEFKYVTIDDMNVILRDMEKIKTSPIDPLPAKFLSKCINQLLPIMVSLINKSLSEGSVEGLKHSVITPIYKKNDMNVNSLNSYRPIFNIPFLCKLTEKVVLKQFVEHIRGSVYDCPYQHGYKKFHSTETMLLEMYDEILLGFDKEFCTVLVMIDMSAAFDTVDIDILLEILYNALNVRGTAFAWFKSFLKDRSQCVKIENSYSDTLNSKFGVPPGSTLGPILFNIYSKGLSDVIIQSGFKTSSYADDSNGRLQFMINVQYSSLCAEIPLLLNNVKSFMNKYFLKMNSDKTEIMLLHPKHLSNTVIQGIFVDKSCVRFTKECRYLGFYIDSNLSFEKQVNDVVSVCNVKIRRIRHLMNCKDTETFVRSVIFSRINYCSTLFLNLSCTNLNKLQKLQNTAFRLIYNLPPRWSVSDKYIELQLLRVNQYVVFKCLLFVHKFFINKVPESIKNLITVYNGTNRLLAVKYYTSTYASKSFSYAAPRYWNKLPLTIRMTDCTDTFKALVKLALLENQNNIMSSTTGYYFIPRY